MTLLYEVGLLIARFGVRRADAAPAATGAKPPDDAAMEREPEKS